MPDLDFILQSLPAATGNAGGSETTQRHVNINLAVIGASQTGKTALCATFVDNQQPSAYKMTLGMELKQKRLQVGATLVHMNLLDFCGHQQYQALLRPLIATADAYFFVFDLTKRDSLDSLRKQITDSVSMNPRFAAVVIGNRCDLTNRRQVSSQQAEEFATSFRLPYMETTITDKTSVVECFRLIGKIAVERLLHAEDVPLQAPPRVKKTAEAKKETPKFNNVKAAVLPSADEEDEF